MLKLSDYPIFQKDIQSNVVNIHPVVVINSDPKIYLSQNEEILNIGTEFEQVGGIDNYLGSTTTNLDSATQHALYNIDVTTNNEFMLEQNDDDYTTQDGDSYSQYNPFNDVSFLSPLDAGDSIGDLAGASIGYYIVIISPTQGAEVMLIIQHGIVGTSVVRFNLSRGIFNTTPYAHQSGEEVHFFSSEPPQEVIDHAMQYGTLSNFTLTDTEVEVEANPTLFKANNLKVPSIKESIDLESRNIKINNITLTFSNQDGFSDLFATQNFLNKYVDIYWKSQSATALEECLPVYKAIIKRVDHDYKNVKLVLEDLTQGVLHKEIPTSIVPVANAYNEKNVNKTIPFVYGKVDKAPCILWKDASQDTSTEKYIYVLPDRYNMPITNTTYSQHYGNDLVAPFQNTILSVFSGTYLYVLNDYHHHAYAESSQAYTSGVQVIEDVDNKIKLVQSFNTELPGNSVSENIVQVVQRRIASAWSLIDFTGTENNVAYNYLGEDDNIFISNPEIAISRDDNLYSQYSGIPDNSISSLEDINTGLIQDIYPWLSLITLDSFQLGTGLGDYVNDDSHLKLWNWDDYSNNHYADFDMDENNNGWASSWYNEKYDPDQAHEDSYAKCVRRTMYDLQDYHEIVALPDSKRLYDMLLIWYLTTYSQDFVGVLGFSEGFRWGTPLDFGLGQEVIGYPNFSGDQEDGYDANPYNAWGNNDDAYDWYNGLSLGGHVFPRYMCRLELMDGSFIYITFQKDYQGDIQDGYDLNGLPEGSISVDYWDLLEFNGFSHGGWGYPTPFMSDIPRYRINQLLSYQEHADSKNYTSNSPYSWDRETWKASYKVGWSGVSPSIWGNTFQNANSSEWKAYFGGLLDHDGFWYDESTHTDFYDWNQFFSQSQWHIHFLEDKTFNSGIVAKKGTLMPTTQFFPIFSRASNNNASWGYGDIKWAGKTMYPGNPENINSEYLPLQHGGSVSENRKLGMLFTLADSNAEDVVDDSSLTYFYGKVGFVSGSENPSNNHTLRLKFLEAVVDPDTPLSETLESLGVGTLSEIHLGEIEENHSDFFDAQGNTDNPTSESWTMPEKFNAGILRLQVESRTDFALDVPAAQNVKAEVYNLGVKHIMEISNALEKTFYVNTLGRNHYNSQNTPTSIIRHIIENELEINLTSLGLIDGLNEWDGNYSNIDGLLSGVFEMAFSQSKKISSKKLIEEIAKSSPLIPIFKSNSKLSFAMIKSSYGASDVTIKAQDVISSSFTRTKIENVKTIVRVKYKKDYARDEYEKVTKYTDAYDFFGNGDSTQSAYENAYKKDYYGLDPSNPGDSVLEIENDYIRDENTAKNLRDFLLAYHCQQHNIIKCKLPLTYVDIEIADIVAFDSLINGMKCYGEDYTQSYTRNGQEIYPYFMVTSVNKSIKSIDIECIQMHNLGRTPGIINPGSGDLDRDGITEVQDAITLNLFIDGFKPYFTEGQYLNADMNFDGHLTVEDVNMILELVAQGG